jgi:hypothetical protein
MTAGLLDAPPPGFRGKSEAPALTVTSLALVPLTNARKTSEIVLKGADYVGSDRLARVSPCCPLCAHVNKRRLVLAASLHKRPAVGSTTCPELHEGFRRILVLGMSTGTVICLR